MKKSLTRLHFILILTLVSSHALHGQATFNNVGIFSAGFHLGFKPDKDLSPDQKIPPLMLAYEAGLSEYITLGAVVAYSQFEYNDIPISYISLGSKGSYHLSPQINDVFNGLFDESKLDIYATASLVLEMKQHDAISGQNDTIQDQEPTIFLDDVGINFGIAAGVRYYFARDVAVFTEVGKGVMGLVCLGVTFRM